MLLLWRGAGAGVSYSFSEDRSGSLLTPAGFLRSSTRGLVTEPPRAPRAPPPAAFVKRLEHPCPASPLEPVFKFWPALLLFSFDFLFVFHF